MCGICGFTGAPDSGALRLMANAIRHRGPDDAGYREWPEISLGMRRLAIVDLETGQQPVLNEDGSVAVVFNGEIYNYPELRALLLERGHQFQTHHSDTEVLVHLYEEFGLEFLHHLNGMFAIALWDNLRKRLVLARDRAGIKPLYYSQAGNRLIFASEIKSILHSGYVGKEPNYPALYHYFSLKNIPAPWSAFKGIDQLGPGEIAVFQDGGFSKRPWWQIRFHENSARPEEETAAQIAHLLEDSVRLRMRADVPFGAYLSGGVDSSSVVALMSRIGGARVKTFSLVYGDEFQHKAADQTYARMVADQFDTEHHEYRLECAEVIDSIEDVLESFDEPFSGVTSTYFITRLIARHVKVALSGDGADELFASYLPHRLAQPLAYFGSVKDRLDRLSEFDRIQLSPFQDKLEYLSEVLNRGDEAERRASLFLWSDQAKQDLLSPGMLAASGGASTTAMIRQVYNGCSSADPLNRALYCDFMTMLPDQVLAFVDRLSMAHSVEVRPPFLDYRLMEFAATIPGAQKIRNGRVKHILKRAVQGLIPNEIIERPKEGFVLPMDLWLLNELQQFVRDTLSPARIAIHGLFNPAAVQCIIEEHYARTANHGPRLWNLIMFQKWWERYFSET